ncbi:MAG TPA: hypothetical protein VKM55_02930 [Candidatus Lokiarchaeia archaeon]|nr:hypothetical protein [Candidatus Lokiarchaeia archaeon]
MGVSPSFICRLAGILVLTDCFMAGCMHGLHATRGDRPSLMKWIGDDGAAMPCQKLAKTRPGSCFTKKYCDDVASEGMCYPGTILMLSVKSSLAYRLARIDVISKF